MKTALWKILAFIVSRRPIAYWLIRRSMATPYFHLTGYMERYWLFNPYAGNSARGAQVASDRKRHRARWPWLPSVRIHHILRADTADHPHDHPWNARTILLDGGYFERRHAGAPRIMRRGDTARIRHGDFHHIEHVTPGGVWTLFFTWGYQGGWGFLVDGVKVPWRVYEAWNRAPQVAPRPPCDHPEFNRLGVTDGSSWCCTCGKQLTGPGNTEVVAS